MTNQSTTQSQPTAGNPTVSSINPSLLKPPSLKPTQSVQTPAEVQQQSGTPHLPAVLPAKELIAVQVETQSDQFIYGQGNIPHKLAAGECIVMGNNGTAYSVRRDCGNAYVLAIGSKPMDNIIRKKGYQHDMCLKKIELININDILRSYAETAGVKVKIWTRVAPIVDGIEIDLGDDKYTRVRLTPRKVEIVESGSETLFTRPSISLPIVLPAETGDIKRLTKYLNLHPVDVTLLIGWITYTIAHPKKATSKFPPLVLIGGEGVGKSFLCHLVTSLIDPNRVVLQKLPSNDKDLAIAAQNSHVICFDNIRSITPAMADNLCTVATGGVLTSRQLYTDADMTVLNLHCAIVLNGIHPFITQQDLAQRCLTIHPQPIAENNRRSESELSQEFHDDLPYIIRGLYDLIAEILEHYKGVTPVCPERMIDFVRWLAAMEIAQGVPAGVYQGVYSESLKDGRLDGLQENELGAAMLDFADKLDGEQWQGTPEELLNTMNSRVSKGTLRSKDWPLNPISLSKKLAVLQAGLKSQGIDIAFTRGKKRCITINTKQTI